MSNHEHRDPPDAGDEADLRRAWQQAFDELPPPQLDAAIIAAARRSVQQRDGAARVEVAGTRPRQPWMRWQPLAAAATVAGLAFVLLQLMPRERDVMPSIRIEESATNTATDSAGKSSADSARDSASESSRDSALNSAPGLEPEPATAPAMERPDMASPPAIERAEMDRAAAEPDAAQAQAVGQATRESFDAGALAAAPEPATAKLQRAEATTTADWAARIVARYDSGDTAGAADLLRAFRAAQPDADSYLPDSMRDWARSVQ